MTASDAYEVGESEFFEEVESFEGRYQPARRISIPGAGLASATLVTPRGPAQLSLPAALPTLTQFRTLEAAVNAQAQRLNVVQADLVRVRRELIARRREQGGLGSSGLLPLLLFRRLRDDFDNHSHAATGALPTVTPSTTGGISSLLPLLLLAPGIFGGSSTPGSSGGGNDTMSPLLLALVFLNP